MTHDKSHVVHLKYMAYIEPCKHDVINGEKKIRQENKEKKKKKKKGPFFLAKKGSEESKRHER